MDTNFEINRVEYTTTNSRVFMNFKEMLSKTRMAISDGVLFIKQFSFIKFLEGSSLNPDESTKKDLGTFEKLGQILVQFIDRHILRKGEVGENLALVGGEGGVSYLPTSSIKPLRFGLTLISLFFSFFFGWLIFAKLDGAVVAPGQVIFSKEQADHPIKCGRGHRGHFNS